MKRFFSIGAAASSPVVFVFSLTAHPETHGPDILPPPLSAHQHKIQKSEEWYQKGLQYLKDSPKGKKTTRQAILFLKKAAEKQHPKAEFELGRVFFDHKAYKLALYWFQRAFRNKNEVFFKTGEEKSDLKTRSAYYMGKCHLKSRPAQPAVAFYELQFAAHQGFTKAFYELGQMYLKGQGVEKDLVLAVKWLSRAARGHDPEATRTLYHLLRTQVSELNHPKTKTPLSKTGTPRPAKKPPPPPNQISSTHCQSRF